MNTQSSPAKKPLPPFPTEGHWLFGSGYLLRTNVIEQLKFLIGKYGDIFSLSLPGRRIVVLTNPEFVKYILLDNSKNYAKSISYDVLRLFLGNGLLTSEGDFWKQQRRLISPAFHRKKLEAITSLMVERVQNSVDKMKEVADTGKYVDMLPELTALTMDVISEAMFSSGVQDKASLIGKQIALLNQFTVDRLRQPVRLPMGVPTPANRREGKALKILDDVIYGIINQRKKDGISKDDLLSMLIDVRDEDTGEAMDNIQLRDEVMTIFVAGNETTANALTWMLYLLSQNPEEEAKLVREIDEKFNKGVELNFNSVMEFQYVRMAVEESLRMYPPAYSLSRRNLTDDEIGGYRVIKDTYVFVPIINYHYDKRYWDEPTKFKPERFAPDKRNQIDRFVYFPFGGGPRICIGNNFALLEMQIAIILFYRNFRFKLKDGFVPEMEPLVTLRPKNGMLMKIEKRN